MPNYTLYFDLPVVGNVGGVGIYIKNSITHKQYGGLKIVSENDCVLENVWLEISKGRQMYIIGGMYRQ